MDDSQIAKVANDMKDTNRGNPSEVFDTIKSSIMNLNRTQLEGLFEEIDQNVFMGFFESDDVLDIARTRNNSGVLMIINHMRVLKQNKAIMESMNNKIETLQGEKGVIEQKIALSKR